nr:PREDICTED: SUN domain-containing protein 5 isoform X4 [Equus przewalskii]
MWPTPAEMPGPGGSSNEAGTPAGRQRSPRQTEVSREGRDDSFLLPIRINATAPGLTQCMLGCMSWITCLACFLRTQAHQVLFNTCRCKLLFQKLMEKTGVLVLCVFGFWVFSVHLPSQVQVWQDDSISTPLQSLRMYQEKVRHHTGEIQDLRGSMNQLIAKLQEMEAMSDEVRCWPCGPQTPNFSLCLMPCVLYPKFG